MSNVPAVERANAEYAKSWGNKGNLPLPPAKKLAIVTCMDARIDSHASLGLKEGDAHVIRNAGGRASDAIRSLVISQQLLGTREIQLYHHTQCGMLTFKDDDARALVRKNLPVGSAGLAQLDQLSFQSFPDLDKSIKEDVEFLRGHPLLHPDSQISGWVHQLEDGKIRRVV